MRKHIRKLKNRRYAADYVEKKDSKIVELKKMKEDLLVKKSYELILSIMLEILNNLKIVLD